jgi:hypothetical protein
MRFFESDEPPAAGDGAARGKGGSGSCCVVDGVNSRVYAAVSSGVDSGGESDVSSGVNFTVHSGAYRRAAGPRRAHVSEARSAACGTKGRRVSYLALPRNRLLAA